jgi:ferredoxin
MTRTVERIVGELRIVIDRDLCVGFGDCVAEAPTAFELDDEGLAVHRPGIADTDRDTLVRACRACPVDALSAYVGDRLVAP